MAAKDAKYAKKEFGISPAKHVLIPVEGTSI
jgi:hypothetical protein